MGPVFSSFVPTLAWAFFLGSFALAAALGAVLAYHWFNFALNRPIAALTLAVYAAGAITLLLALLVATVIVTSP